MLNLMLSHHFQALSQTYLAGISLRALKLTWKNFTISTPFKIIITENVSLECLAQFHFVVILRNLDSIYRITRITSMGAITCNLL